MESFRLEETRPSNSGDGLVEDDDVISVVGGSDDDDDNDDDGFLEEMKRLGVSEISDSLNLGNNKRYDDDISEILELLLHSKESDESKIEDADTLRSKHQKLLQKIQILFRDKTTVKLHLSVMNEVCRDEDMSLFQRGRLAELSCYEYQNTIYDRTSRRVQNDYRLLVNWLCEQMQSILNKHKVESEDRKLRIQQARDDILIERNQKVTELRHALVEKRKFLLAALQEKRKSELSS